MTEDVEARVQGAPDVQCVGDHGELSDEQKDGAGIRDLEVDGPVKRGIKYFGGSLDSAWTRSRNPRDSRNV